MDLLPLKDWLALAISVVALVSAWRRSNRTDLTRDLSIIREEIEENRDKAEANRVIADTKMTAMGDRLTKVEGKIDGLPTKDDIHRLDMGQQHIKGQLDVLAESLRPVERIATRMQEMMLEREGDAPKARPGRSLR